MGERNTPSSVRGQITCLGFPGPAAMPSDVDDPERWRTQARAAGKNIFDLEAKGALLSIAKGYERLARWEDVRKKNQEYSE
jgi:hypothetical protein